MSYAASDARCLLVDLEVSSFPLRTLRSRSWCKPSFDAIIGVIASLVASYRSARRALRTRVTSRFPSLEYLVARMQAIAHGPPARQL